MKVYSIAVEFESETNMNSDVEFIPQYNAMFKVISNKLDNELEIELVEILDEYSRKVLPTIFTKKELNQIESDAIDKFYSGTVKMEVL